MSQRNLRKLYGHSSIAPPSDSSEDEYEPLYARNPTRSTYEGLVVSSSEESDHENGSKPEEPDPGEAKKKELPKSSKKQNPKRRNFAKERNDLDEIDRSILEVNELLGEPEPREPVERPQRPPDLFHIIFSVTYRNLNVSNEMRKMFGNDPEQSTSRRGRQPELKKNRYTIIPREYNHKKHGLSMSMRRGNHNLIYFTYDHSRDYQKRHKEFLVHLLQRPTHAMGPAVEGCFQKMHVEGLLEASDLLFRSDNSPHACAVIEKIVSYLQYVAHPLFNITDINARLEYKVPENRPFFIAVLKYLYLLSNRACHRTALELAKLLLNLEPTDPLAVVFIIDTLAIRAREYQWLVHAIDYLDKERDAGYLFNIKYSYALARFHIANKNKEDLGPCDELLQKAIITFPWVVKDLLKHAGVNSFKLVHEHDLFNAYGNSTNCSNLKGVTRLYAALIGSWWSDPAVVQWLIRNTEIIAYKFDRDPFIKADVKRVDDLRSSIFASLPNELIRHLHVIKYMSDLVADGMVPPMQNMLCFDPQPPLLSINRYNYGVQPTMTYLQLSFNEALVSNFFASMNPNYDMSRGEQLYDLYYSNVTWTLPFSALNTSEDDADESEAEESGESNGSDNAEEKDPENEDGQSDDDGDNQDDKEQEGGEDNNDQLDDGTDTSTLESAGESEQIDQAGATAEPEEIWSD